MNAPAYANKLIAPRDAGFEHSLTLGIRRAAATRNEVELTAIAKHLSALSSTARGAKRFR